MIDVQELTLGDIAIAVAFIVAFIKGIEYLVSLANKPLKSIESHVCEVAEEVKSLSKKTSDHFATSDRAQALMIKDKVEGYYYKKCAKDGYIGLEELNTVNELFDSYKKLGGNGTMHRVVEFLNELPIKEED